GPAAGAAAPPAAASPAKSNRRRLFGLFAAVLLVGAVGYILYDVLVLSHVVSTDDAYVGADMAQITPQVNGQVLQVNVADTQVVRAGQVLVVIDPADARLALAQAQADYERAVRRVQQYMANDQAAGAQIQARDADLLRSRAQVAAAQSDVDRTSLDLKRREALSASGAVSGEELSTARNAYQTAVANLDAVKAAGAQGAANKMVAQGQLASSLALTQGSSLDDNPEVAAARAAVDVAKLNLSRTVLRAPFDGVVSQRNVQLGQRVAIGAQLMTVVPISQVYVNANFKEVQLRKVEVGQPAELTADRYGKGVVFHGRVEGLSGGTGSAMALIPAQNATGNWIKVVQRLPVRIRLDPRELERHPLRVGLSMDVKVDVAGPGAPSPAPGRARAATASAATDL
ncbi:HlyD family efflux transporter periplasmic adaptor subunit, partial [Caulobacter sp. S45]|uniref:HlyD family secretion protein n=1 Tax=Caulobacter sp. S45 TaxID=1641861 RepID=UPI0035304739